MQTVQLTFIVQDDIDVKTLKDLITLALLYHKGFNSDFPVLTLISNTADYYASVQDQLNKLANDHQKSKLWQDQDGADAPADGADAPSKETRTQSHVVESGSDE